MADQLTARVLVTDGEQRSALAIVRSLGLAGYQVTVAASHPFPLAGASRFSSATIQTPDPAEHPGQFVDSIEEFCRTKRVEWLIPVSEAALRALLPARRRFHAHMPFPDAAVFAAISDKARLLVTAAELGIDTPLQEVLPSKNATVSTAGVGFPLVVKPSRSVVDGRQFTARYASDGVQLGRILAGLPAGAYPVLLQERIIGQGTGIFLLPWDGATRAVFAHRRIREKPPSGGVSVVSESILAAPDLVAQSERLLRAFDWKGVAMVEYKHDVQSGRTVLMEVNGRFWGSLQLAVDSGVDFPLLLLECAQGRCPAAPPAYACGIRSRWWWGDVDHLLMRLRGSRLSLNLPADSPSSATAVLDFLKERGRNVVLRLGDLRPAARESINWLLRR